MDDKPAAMQPGPAIIRRVPLLAALSDGEIDALWAGSRHLSIEPGATVIEEGAKGDALFIILAGEFEVTKRIGDRDIVLAASRKAGEVFGEMSLLEQVPRTASVRATTAGELLEISTAALHTLLDRSPATARNLLQTIAGRLRSTEALLVQSDKLASLGTLAAGLAHELNNPAAAIQRSGSLLKEAFETWRARTIALSRIEATPEQLQRLSELDGEIARTARSTAKVSQQDEDRLIDWLDSRSIREPWELAPVLASYDWTEERLAPLADDFPGPHLGAVIEWLGAGLSVQQLLEEIQLSSKAISNIVHAVKSYAYLDQAPVQSVDLRQSLEDTLMILNHKVKHGIEVVRAFDPAVPKIEAYAGELNQVWTNIIDNAIQAMEGKGRLNLSVRCIGAEVEVRICDSGPGIPHDLAARIFEPFFTTKPQGIGTGLGLHIAHDIIVVRHHGRIDVDSEPGHTEFRVVLPVRLPH